VSVRRYEGRAPLPWPWEVPVRCTNDGPVYWALFRILISPLTRMLPVF
jgi:hypothetical protein